MRRDRLNQIGTMQRSRLKRLCVANSTSSLGIKAVLMTSLRYVKDQWRARAKGGGVPDDRVARHDVAEGAGDRRPPGDSSQRVQLGVTRDSPAPAEFNETEA